MTLLEAQEAVTAALGEFTDVVAESPIAAGVAVVALDTGRVLMIQRAMIDGEAACGKWEFPGGKIDEGETAWEAAQREFSEEVGFTLPEGFVTATWLSSNGVYRCFVYLVPAEGDLALLDRGADGRDVEDPDNPGQENYTEAVAWFDPSDLDRGPRILREECRSTPWNLLKGYVAPTEVVLAAAQTVHLDVVPRIDWTRVDGRTLAYLKESGALLEEQREEFESLVASISSVSDALLPTEDLAGPTPYTVSEDGLTADGHLALWASCHIGFPGCVKPPQEKSFDFYNLSPTHARGQEIGVGRVTVGTGHAGPDLNWRTAAAHYDNSGNTVAIAHAVRDRWGIRLPSVIVASATEQQVDELRTHPLSGDWRRINGRLRLVASLGVNVPGYPVPRALVAAGEVQSMFVGFNLEDAAAAQIEADELAESLGLDHGSRAESLRASLNLPTG